MVVVILALALLFAIATSLACALIAVESVADRRRATEAMNYLMERLSTRKDVVLASPTEAPAREAEKPYITDLPHDDARWNEFIGADDEEPNE